MATIRGIKAMSLSADANNGDRRYSYTVIIDSAVGSRPLEILITPGPSATAPTARLASAT